MHPWDPSRWKRGLPGLLGLFETRLWGPSRWKEDLLGLLGLYSLCSQSHLPLQRHSAHSGHLAPVAPALLSVPALHEDQWVLEALPPSKQALGLLWGLSVMLPWALQAPQPRGLNPHVALWVLRDPSVTRQ
jgi:hypothetical protein